MSSVSFDRAADIYDATRALPPEVDRALTDALMKELTAVGAERVLEVGVGTGRIARPLAERGVRVCGVDIASRMLARLREQLGPRHVAPDLLLGDATRLPLADGSFPAAIIVHVLHLVSSPNAALGELRRVLSPGGVFLHPITDYPGENPWAASRQKSAELLRGLGVVTRKRPDREEIHAMLRGLGASLRTETVAEVQEEKTPVFWLDSTRDRIDSWSWEIPEDVFPEFFARYEQWNREHFGDLDRVFVQKAVHQIEVWQF
ncbi:MAG: class I SAM-dependent methyltransferase [Dehalococcoidia bacterium]